MYYDDYSVLVYAQMVYSASSFSGENGEDESGCVMVEGARQDERGPGVLLDANLSCIADIMMSGSHHNHQQRIRLDHTDRQLHTAPAVQLGHGFKFSPEACR